MPDSSVLTPAAGATGSLEPDHRKLRCPATGGPLNSSYANEQGRGFVLGALTNPRNGRKMDVVDLREDSDFVRSDRSRLREYQDKFSRLMLDEPADLPDLDKDVPYDGGSLTVLKHRLRVYWDQFKKLTRYLVTRKYTTHHSFEGSSIDKSLQAYARSHELFSTLVAEYRPYVYQGRLLVGSTLNLIKYNMSVLYRFLRDVGATEVLDFGCGAGTNLIVLKKVLDREDRLRLTGFDYSLCRLVTSFANVTTHDVPCEGLFCANGVRLPLADNSYDVVFSHWVLEQMLGYEPQALAEMARVARKGVVLIEPSVYRNTFLQRLYMSHMGFTKHLHQFVAERADLEVVELRNMTEAYYYPCPSLLVLAKKRAAT